MTAPDRITPESRLALLMHGHLRDSNGKMGFGLLRYSTATVTCVIAAEEAGGDLREIAGIDSDVPIVSNATQAASLGADVLVIAVATTGGILPPGYRDDIVAGLDRGMSLVNGLHGTYAEDAEFAAALRPGAFIWDIRREPDDLSAARGAARQLDCRRVLTVGSDMAVGKMTTSLELDRGARERGLRSKFIATGQIGIAISGDGVPLDAIRVDFAPGSVEALCLRYGPDHDVLWVEGQGSILHPGSSAWLATLRGSMATDLVLVHRPGQQTLDELDDFVIPPLPEIIALYEAVASPTRSYPPARVRAIALNGSHLTDDDVARAVEEITDLTGLPTADPVRQGADDLLDAIFT